MRFDATRTKFGTAAVLLALGLAACSGSSRGSSYGSGDPNLAASNPGGGTISPFLADGQAVSRALDAIEARVGKPLRVTSMTSDRMNGLMVDVQEPKNHIAVDQYTISPDGKLGGPTPVKLMSLAGGPITVADVERRAFDPRAVGFERLSATAREAIAKSKYADARVSEWDFAGVGPDDRRYLYLDSARARPVAVLGPHLTILDMRF